MERLHGNSKEVGVKTGVRTGMIAWSKNCAVTISELLAALIMSLFNPGLKEFFFFSLFSLLLFAGNKNSLFHSSPCEDMYPAVILPVST